MALDRLEAYQQAVNLGDAVPFIAALFDIGDDLPEESGGTLVGRHVDACVENHPLVSDEGTCLAKRHSHLAEAMRMSGGLYLPVM